MDSPSVTQTRSRRQLVVAGAAIAGTLLFAGLFWFGFHWLLTPRTPDLAQATAADVAAYLADPRGLQGMAGPSRQAFLDAVVQHYQAREQRQQLAHALEDISPGQRDTVRDAIFDTMKAQVLDDARQFQRLTDAAARRLMLEANIDKYDTLRRWLAGGKGMPNLTASMSTGLDDQQDWSQYLLTHTTPAERDLAQAYLTDLAQAAALRKLKHDLSAPAKP